jgi:hypothetical protein
MKKKDKKLPKLTLNKETLRELTPLGLAARVSVPPVKCAALLRHGSGVHRRVYIPGSTL